MSSRSGGAEAGDGRSPVPVECDRLYQSLLQCHRRVPRGLPRESTCRHLNQSLAECILAVACPAESEAVRALCGSGGTALKRSQCRQAQLFLSTCISSHQDQS